MGSEMCIRDSIGRSMRDPLVDPSGIHWTIHGGSIGRSIWDPLDDPLDDLLGDPWELHWAIHWGPLGRSIGDPLHDRWDDPLGDPLGELGGDPSGDPLGDPLGIRGTIQWGSIGRSMEDPLDPLVEPVGIHWTIQWRYGGSIGRSMEDPWGIHGAQKKGTGEPPKSAPLAALSGRLLGTLYRAPYLDRRRPLRGEWGSEVQVCGPGSGLRFEPGNCRRIARFRRFLDELSELPR